MSNSGNEATDSVPVGELWDLVGDWQTSARDRESMSGEQPWDYEADALREAAGELRRLIREHE